MTLNALEKKILRLIEKGKPYRASEIIEAHLDEYKNSPNLYLLYGIASINLFNYIEARIYLNRALLIDKNNIEVLQTLAFLNLKENKTGDAVENYLHILDIDPQNKTARKKLDMLKLSQNLEQDIRQIQLADFVDIVSGDNFKDNLLIIIILFLILLLTMLVVMTYQKYYGQSMECPEVECPEPINEQDEMSTDQETNTTLLYYPYLHQTGYAYHFNQDIIQQTSTYTIQGKFINRMDQLREYYQDYLHRFPNPPSGLSTITLSENELHSTMDQLQNSLNDNRSNPITRINSIQYFLNLLKSSNMDEEIIRTLDEDISINPRFPWKDHNNAFYNEFHIAEVDLAIAYHFWGLYKNIYVKWKGTLESYPPPNVRRWQDPIVSFYLKVNFYPQTKRQDGTAIIDIYRGVESNFNPREWQEDISSTDQVMVFGQIDQVDVNQRLIRIRVLSIDKI